MFHIPYSITNKNYVLGYSRSLTSTASKILLDMLPDPEGYIKRPEHATPDKFTRLRLPTLSLSSHLYSHKERFIHTLSYRLQFLNYQRFLSVVPLHCSEFSVQQKWAKYAIYTLHIDNTDRLTQAYAWMLFYTRPSLKWSFELRFKMQMLVHRSCTHRLKVSCSCLSHLFTIIVMFRPFGLIRTVSDRGFL